MNDKFANIETLEVFEFYDRPVLFLIQNEALELFLVQLLDEEWMGDKRVDVYMSVELSPARLEALRAGAIDLRSAFTQAELGYVWITADDQRPYRTVNCPTLTDDQLPEPGFFCRGTTISRRNLILRCNGGEIVLRWLQ